MTRESLVLGIAGIFFGFLVGWMFNDQFHDEPAVSPPAAQAQPAATPSASAKAPQLDPSQVEALQTAAAQRKSDPAPRVELGNLYFDAGQYPEAIKWYEEALALNPRDPDVSTDLGVGYYYADEPDRALAQFKHSLSIDPKHTKTLLNEGIVRAFSKRDLEGAAAAWEQVLKLAPDSPEGRAARQALESLKAANPAMGGRPAQPGG